MRPCSPHDLETGTAKLVTAQSVSRVRWIATKLGVTALVVVVCTMALSAAFTWWWSPIKSSPYVMSWIDGPAFDNTGPVPVALTLLTVVGGVAIGMLLRRTLLSMVVTLGFAVVLQVVWSYFRTSLGNVITVTTHNGVGNDSTPNMPEGAHQLDEFYLTASGDLIGWGSCAEATEKARDACLDKAQVVGWSVDYIPISQMSAMQWLGASILLALTHAASRRSSSSGVASASSDIRPSASSDPTLLAVLSPYAAERPQRRSAASRGCPDSVSTSP